MNTQKYHSSGSSDSSSAANSIWLTSFCETTQVFQVVMTVLGWSRCFMCEGFVCELFHVCSWLSRPVRCLGYQCNREMPAIWPHYIVCAQFITPLQSSWSIDLFRMKHKSTSKLRTVAMGDLTSVMWLYLGKQIGWWENNLLLLRK